MKISKKNLKQIIEEEIKKALTEEVEEEEVEEEEVGEDDYNEDYEQALAKIQDCEKRVEYLTKRLEHAQEKKKPRRGSWSDLW